MRRKTYIGLLLIAVIASTSCNPPSYIPTMVNTPMFNNKGEFQATVAAGSTNFDAQLGYAITKNIGIIVNGSYADQKNDSTDEFHKHTIYEAGLGYYTPIYKRLMFEAFVGYGKADLETMEDDGIADANYDLIFLQPAIGITNDFITASFAPRINIVDIDYLLNDKMYNKSTYFITPTFTVKGGYKYVKMVVQFGFNFSVDEYIDFEYEKKFFNFGLTFTLGRKYDEIKQK
jgi:hypothetical protein